MSNFYGSTAGGGGGNSSFYNNAGSNAPFQPQQPSHEQQQQQQGQYQQQQGQYQQQQQQPATNAPAYGQPMQPQQPQAAATPWTPPSATGISTFVTQGLAVAASGGITGDGVMNFVKNQADSGSWKSGWWGVDTVMQALRAYFAVDNKYVQVKMQKVLFPFTSKHWKRAVSHECVLHR